MNVLHRLLKLKSAGILVELAKSTRIQLIFSISASLLICLLIGGLYYYQRANFLKQASITRSFREARLDLYLGFLHVENSRQVGAPFELGQGMALIRQAIRDFEDAANQWPEELSRDDRGKVEAFQREVEILESDLIQIGTTAEELGQRMVALRMRFHQLSKMAEVVDQHLQERMQQTSDSQLRAFLIVLSSSIVLLCLILLLVLIANSKARESDLARANAQTEIRKTLELLHAIVNGTPDFVFVKDVNCKYILVNRALTEFFGRELGEFLGVADDVIFEKKLAQKFVLNDLEVMLGGSPISYEATIETPSDTKTYSISKAPYKGQSGEVLGVIGICRDITLDRHSQRIEVVGRLAGGIAHDFNNLLTVINCHAELALMNRELPKEVRLGIETIQDAGGRAAGLTSQLLSFSRKAIVSPKVLNLNESIRNSANLIKRLITENIELTIDLCDSELLIQIDPNQLDQVLMNLAVNARDAMPKGGALEIRTRASNYKLPGDSVLGDITTQDSVEIVVKDYGSGIPKDNLNHIFEPFFTTKGPSHGTGLGLAVVQGVVEQAGGKIAVESELNRGTEFYIYLPRVQGASRETTESKPALQGIGRETILVVEDEELLGKLCESVLKGHGYNVLRASDSAGAMQLFIKHCEVIDLMLTDVILPGYSGHQLAQQIRAISKFLPVIYMSGYTDDEVLRSGVRESTDHFLQKPFTHDGLVRRIRACLESVRTESGVGKCLAESPPPPLRTP